MNSFVDISNFLALVSKEFKIENQRKIEFTTQAYVVKEQRTTMDKKKKHDICFVQVLGSSAKF